MFEDLLGYFPLLLAAAAAAVSNGWRHMFEDMLLWANGRILEHWYFPEQNLKKAIVTQH